MIISILGTAGRDYETKEPKTSYYDCKILEKSNGNFYNSTNMLIKNYEDEDFYFIGTEYAIEFQKKLLNFTINTKFITVKDDSLDDIFEEVYKLLLEDDGNIILDITHGFRHQPISAIFSATLHMFLHDIHLKIIYAKVDEVDDKKYKYIYLDQYIQISQLSLMLTGFIRTLNFVNSVEVENLDTVAFEEFSKALLSNDFRKLESSYVDLSNSMEEAKKHKKFDHLKELFKQIKNTLACFKDFSSKELYERYIILANLMFEKNYYLLSLTYLFEAIRIYCTHSFKTNNLIKEKYTIDKDGNQKDSYSINTSIISFVTQDKFERYSQTVYDKDYSRLYLNNKQYFLKISNEYDMLRRLRNDLTHINPEKSQLNINKDLGFLLKNISTLLEDNILKDLKK